MGTNIGNNANTFGGVVHNQYVKNTDLGGYITTTIGTSIDNYANTLSGVV